MRTPAELTSGEHTSSLEGVNDSAASAGTAQRTTSAVAFRPPISAARPWGPLVYRVPCRGSRERALASAVAACAAGVLLLAAWLKPDPAGHGTHQQLGLAPCTFLAITGYPCPTCGMTTAFAWTVRGHWLKAASVQPMGFLLAVATMITLAGALNVLATGRSWAFNWLRISPGLLALISLLLFLAAWAYTILGTMAHASPPWQS
ncbi:MAG TPA: DUF2752 domain-containing protein [Phycisphaerae bacterium]|jgi:hypothetical protein